MYKNFRTDGIIDFILSCPHGRDYKILQLTDTQLIDSSQCRTADRLKPGEAALWLPELKEKNCFSYIRSCVEQTNPDLIILTGDNVYGEFDDSGESLRSLCAVMDSFKIPWAPVFGNHDNESKMGVEWQCKQFTDAEYCIFNRGTTDGNSNYTIGLESGGQLVRILYMADSNACFGATDESVCKRVGFTKKQFISLENISQSLKQNYGYVIPAFFCFHIGTSQYSDAAYNCGYQSDSGAANPEKYEIGIDVSAKNGDFGYKGEIFGGALVTQSEWETIKNAGIDGMFCGHTHNNSESILHDGVRLTCGLKTGTYDYHLPDRLGGTLITVKNGTNKFDVRHIFVKAE